MHKRILILLIFVVLAFLPTSSSMSTEYHIEPLEWYVSQAKIIARVRLLRREPVEFVYEDRRDVCTYRFTAQIEEILKGEKSEVLEFYGSEVGFVGTNQEYLIMVFEQDPDEAKEVLAPYIDLMVGIDKARIRCRDEAGRLFVRSIPQTMVPFVGSAAAQFGGRWLAPHEYTALPLSRFRQEVIQRNGERVVVTSWDHIRNELQGLIRKAPK